MASKGKGALSGDLEAARLKMEAAVTLLDSETADGIIETSTEELATLERGAQAAVTLLWGMVQACGVRKVALVKKAMAQAMLVLATLVHIAYALGIRVGEARGDSRGDSRIAPTGGGQDG